MKKIICLLIILLLSLSSCDHFGGMVSSSLPFDSCEDLAEFVSKYNSKRDDFTFTFVLFDFPESSGIETYLYKAWTTRDFKRNLFTGENIYEEFYDKTHGKTFLFDMIFYMDEASANDSIIERAYQIHCRYMTPYYNFYQSDEMRIELISSNTSAHSEDMSSWTLETHSYTRYYRYKYIYKLYVNDVETVTITVSAENEPSAEKLEEICQLLLDNIVIINAEE